MNQVTGGTTWVVKKISNITETRTKMLDTCHVLLECGTPSTECLRLVVTHRGHESRDDYPATPTKQQLKKANAKFPVAA
jgi:hypothetical protein